jgi:hypothetical protein
MLQEAHIATSNAFYEALVRIMGAEAAASCARRYSPLHEIFHNDVFGYEALAIYAYTTPMEWYEVINSELRSGSPSREVVLFAHVLNSVLSKLPKYQGLVYRGIRVADVASLLQGHPEGGRVTAKAFTSAARRPELAFVGNVLFTIHSRSAANIWMWTADYAEDEVVFSVGTEFEVLSVERRGNEVAITLREF